PTSLAAARPAAAQVGGRPAPVAVPASPLDVAVVGAGVFGAWTAAKLRDAGFRVLLVDPWGPAHARASSGGESRMIRGAYGADEIYTRMALSSLEEWRALSRTAGLPLFAETGVLFFFPDRDPYALATIEVHRRFGLPTQVLERAEMARRFPAIDFEGVALGLYEPQFGVLMARRAVQTLVARFVEAGGSYLAAQVLPPDAAAGRLTQLRTVDGQTINADRFVFATGPWLPRLFPDLLARRIRPTRQEVFFFRPPAGDPRFGPGQLPGWADFNGGDLFYGMPDLEARGFKIARDTHGPVMDPDLGDRVHSAEALARAHAFMARRFPALADAPLNESRVCQYENSANGDFLIDRHPRWHNTVLVGAGSGHGFKMGPAVGAYAAALATGAPLAIEPRFSLASKAESGERLVH
ncbi:FAD-dependent oxidoreductase, partial [Sphingosinicella sp. YJ22]|uniref:FAD-dependent oxidoreductase n=1 Tax=Sphingosinicella sp. YJ22 TaxID=1104780 RepID=UPI001408E40C